MSAVVVISEMCVLVRLYVLYYFTGQAGIALAYWCGAIARKLGLESSSLMSLKTREAITVGRTALFISNRSTMDVGGQ